MLKAGDSVQIKVPVDSMDLPPFDQRPPFLKPGATLVYRIAIKKIQTVDEANAERESAANRRHEEELVALDRFLDTKKIQVKKAPEGLRYYIRDSSERKKPVPGDTVWVNYIGRTLQDKVFDSSIENVALRANLKQPGRIYVPFKFVVGEGNVIPGWEKAIPFFAEGNKISVFIPSKFAYGEQGAGADIPPNATLWFDIDLVKVHPKQEPVVKKAPVKKAPIRKAPVKKPAVKAPAKKG
ncbi:MAG: FKBP-type peptidyl-prolyl cis-trans isomerase [Mucilaginibacter polytrichastri]|nr:FKBP-type peptidyl-prolyl cis-trans isomerase [Mucilaginibacter polytrichastri]